MRFNPTLWLALLAAAAANGSPTWMLDPAQSRIEIAVKATAGSFVARLTEFQATVAAAAPSGPVETGIFRFDFAAIKTGNAHRDRDMIEWEQTNQFPAVVFRLTAVGPAVDGRSIARGQLRFHGRERPVSFPISIQVAAPSITVEGELKLDTRDYGLPVIKQYLILKVDPLVHLRFHLQGHLTGS